MWLRSLFVATVFTLVAPTLAFGAVRPLDLGFFDYTFSNPDGALRRAWLQDAQASGATAVRIHISWARVAPVRPIEADNGADPAYRWADVDAAVQDATTRGLKIMLSIHNAPAWAEGPRRPKRAPPASWMPSPSALASFVNAASRRYAGVTTWQVWNEPNLSIYLSPQWSRRDGRWVPTAALHYRRMLNASYAALKAVNRKNVVVTAGTAPYGDPPGRTRTRPLTFWKAMLRSRTTFDVFAHHPYSIAGPRRHALNRNDLSVPDLGRLQKVVRTAVRRGRALRRSRDRLWITEISWDSNPPDPYGVPARRQATWLADAMYILWKQRAQAVFWYQVRDEEPIGGFDITNQSGVYLRSGLPKLAQNAFAFPLACHRLARGGLRVWGKAPVAGSLSLTRKGKTVRRLRVGSTRVFLATVPGNSGVRATTGNRTSLMCVP